MRCGDRAPAGLCGKCVEVEQTPDRTDFEPLIVSLAAEWSTLEVSEQNALLKQLIRRVALVRTDAEDGETSAVKVEGSPGVGAGPLAGQGQGAGDGYRAVVECFTETAAELSGHRAVWGLCPRTARIRPDLGSSSEGPLRYTRWEAVSGTVREDVVSQLVDVVRTRSAPHHGPVGEPTVLADRRDATVIRHGSVVAKAHASDTDPDELSVRVRVAGHPGCAGILLPPLGGPEALPGGRAVTLWPYGEPVSPDHPEAAPWAEAGALLARLHAVAPGALPPMRGPAKAARAVARLRAVDGGGAAAGAVLRAWAALPGWARGEGAALEGALCHGDFHLGQLVRCAPGWVLIDVDDLGLGDPAWDLARPAAWYAAGLLAPEDWERFLGAYRAAGGLAVRGCQEDPWARLDLPARALTVQMSALALAKGRPLDEAQEAMVESCVRIARLAAA